MAAVTAQSPIHRRFRVKQAISHMQAGKRTIPTSREQCRVRLEARLLKGQASQQDRLERQPGELAVLNGQLVQAQTAKDTLLERLAILQSKNAGLEKAFRRRANVHKAYR